MNRIFAIVVACLAIILAGCQSKPTLEENSLSSVTGSVTYRERIALPADALVTVTLQDISLADAPAKVIAKHRFETNGQQVPFEFDLAYNTNKIDPRHRYSVSARIEVNGELRFISETVNSVITNSEQTDHVDVRLIGVGR